MTMDWPPAIDQAYAQSFRTPQDQSLMTCIRKFPLPREQELWSPSFDAGLMGVNNFDGYQSLWNHSPWFAEKGSMEHQETLSNLSTSYGGGDEKKSSGHNSSDDDCDFLNQAFSGDVDVFPPGGEGTTVMLCNIPCRVGRTDIINALESHGFQGMYNFIHLPKGKSRRYRRYGNIGYSFINFTNAEDADRFATAFEDFQFPGLRSTKKCTVKLAHLQGYNAKGEKGRAEQVKLFEDMDGQGDVIGTFSQLMFLPDAVRCEL